MNLTMTSMANAARQGGATVCWMILTTALVAGCTSSGLRSVPEIQPQAQKRAPAVEQVREIEALDVGAVTLDSREYKILLKRDKFTNRTDGATKFWGLLEKQADGELIVEESIDPEEKSRHVWFLDTQKFALKGQDFIFRQRNNLKKNGERKKKKKATLKYRGGNDDIARSLNLAAEKQTEDDEPSRPKLEQDVGVKGLDEPVLERKLSNSGTTQVPKTRSFTTVKHIVEHFPEVGKFIADMEDQKLEQVNQFLAYEVKRDAGTITLADGCKAEASYTFWYPENKVGAPEVAEFSFNYDLKPNCEDVEVDTRAASLLMSLAKSKEWLDPTQKTKTQVAYESR